VLSYKKIMVPYDGSDHAKEALKQACALAQAGDGTKLYVASICNMISAMSNFDQVSIAEGCLTTKLSKDLEDQCKHDLAEAAASIPKDIEHEELFEIGSPGPALLEMADDHGIDLIVMGSRGLGPLKGIFMGSVSSYMVSRSKCPILIVK
jgi:nucleotide-binding universal stress UspA family protein